MNFDETLSAIDDVRSLVLELKNRRVLFKDLGNLRKRIRESKVMLDVLRKQSLDFERQLRESKETLQ